MRYLALATDYDGTMARNGIVDSKTLQALQRLRESGRHLILVTGRIMPDLQAAFPEFRIFERIVAENGPLVYDPESGKETLLSDPPPEKFVETLRRKGVSPLDVGRIIVATLATQKELVLDTIQELGLELQLIFNKESVIVLPSGINKATGLRVALAQLGLSVHNAVGVGDAENDLAFLRACECAVAVDNALPSAKEAADIVTAGARGAGVRELIERLITNDLEDVRVDRCSTILKD